ncbi:Uncharacterised protein [Klebsiella pneumoniae]|nr:Uncharacterised protein [Klebsiella pneumoniae]
MLLKQESTSGRRSLSKAEQAERNRRIYQERWESLREELQRYGTLGEPQETLFDIEVESATT